MKIDKSRMPKVRRGQLWRKRSNGVLCEVVGGERRADRVKIAILPKGKTHSTRITDLYRFFDKV